MKENNEVFNWKIKLKKLLKKQLKERTKIGLKNEIKFQRIKLKNKTN